MNFIFFKRSPDSKIEMVLREFEVRTGNVPVDRDNHVFTRQIVPLMKEQGVLSILTKTGDLNPNKILSDCGFYDCGTKRNKVELRRSLKLDQKGLKDRPRYIYAQYQDIGSFKRSLSPFLKIGYRSNDPGCVVIIDLDTAILKNPKWLNSLNLDNTIENTEVPAEKVPYYLKWMSELREDEDFQQLRNEYIGSSLQSELVRALIVKASKRDFPVTIIGESGTGKTLVAKLIHKFSTRKNGPVEVYRCRPILDQLFEAELFGVASGTFPGALGALKGLLEKANNGIIIFEEVHHLGGNSQKILMHLLDNKSYFVVGTTERKSFNIRFLATDTKELPDFVQNAQFDRKLYYKLNSFKITIKPLRERKEDIPALVRQMWGRISGDSGISEEVINYLKDQQLLGNMTELGSVLKNAFLVFEEKRLTIEALKSIQWIRDDVQELQQVESGNLFRLLLDESRSLLQDVLKNFREIRVKIRPLVNANFQDKAPVNHPQLKEIQSFVLFHLSKQDEWLQKPHLFHSLDLFQKVRTFRFDFENLVKQLTIYKIPHDNVKKFNEVWHEKYQKPYDEIFDTIFKMIWEN